MLYRSQYITSSTKQVNDPASMILGIGVDDKLWTRDGLDASWQKAPDQSNTVRSIAIMADGIIIGVGMDDNIVYSRANLDAPWIKARDVESKFISIAVAKNRGMIAVGVDNKLWVRPTLSDGWEPAPDKNGKVMAVTIMEDGTILGVGMDNKLWTRANLDAPWIKAPDMELEVIDVTIMSDGSILGLGKNNKLYLRPTLDDEWEMVSAANELLKGIACYPVGNFTDEEDEDEEVETATPNETELPAIPTKPLKRPVPASKYDWLLKTAIIFIVTCMLFSMAIDIFNLAEYLQDAEEQNLSKPLSLYADDVPADDVPAAVEPAAEL